jgi:hypothetical protein
MKLSFLSRSLSLVGLLAVFMGQSTWATAGVLGGMAGFITDAKTGAPLAGVRVEISSPSQTINTTTDAHGHYAALSLPPDDYTVTAVKDGYGSLAVTGESVFADQTQQYDLKLTPESANSSG